VARSQLGYNQLSKFLNVILFFDTSDPEQVQLALIDQRIVWHKFASRNLSEELLPQIQKFCQKQKVKLNNLAKIAVVVGPGGFSRVRTAVSTANALAFGLSIPVIGLKKEQIDQGLDKISSIKGQKIVAPFYDKNPNITLAKK